MNQHIDELKQIWKRNTFWENICWIGNCLLASVLLPYCILREILRDLKKK